MEAHELRLAAQLYQLDGFDIFPAYPNGKEPWPNFKWKEQATKDPRLINQWWGEGATTLSNIAIATGERSGITVLDFDCKNGEPGLETAAQMLGANWHETWRHTCTPNNGMHLYIQYQAHWGNHKLRTIGLDIQGNGAYVVAPPSMVGGRPYTGTPFVYPCSPALDEWVCYQIEAHGGHGSTRTDTGEVPPEWVLIDVPSNVDLGARIAPRVRPFWTTGQLGSYASRSEAVLGVCVSLMSGLRMTPAGCLAAIVENPHCWATALDRRPQGDDSTVEWLWTYCVAKVIPPTVSEVFNGVENSTHGRGRTDSGSIGVPFEPASDPVRTVLQTSDAGDNESNNRGVSSVQNPQGSGAPATPVDATASAEPSSLSQALSVVEAASFEVENAQGILEGLAQLNLLPHEEDAVLKAVSTKYGMGVIALRATMKAIRQAGLEEKKFGGASELVERYVYVAGSNSVYDLVERTDLTPIAFANMYGLENAADLVQGGMLPRVTNRTYLPLNQWAPGFDNEAWRYPIDDTTGQPTLNLWHPTRCHPDLTATFQDIEPWWNHWIEVMRIPYEEVTAAVRYLAFMCQHPEIKINHMLILGGTAGIGKDMVLHPLNHVLGPENIEPVRQNVLDSDFDPDISRAKLMMIVELASSSWDKSKAHRVYNMLKPYASAPPERLSLHLKKANAFSIPNRIQVVAQTNYRTAMVLDQDDRRCLMVWCPGAKPSQDYVRGMWKWLEEGGADKVAGWLLRLDVSDFDPKAPPIRTEWALEALEASLGELAGIVRGVLDTAVREDDTRGLGGPVIWFDDLLAAVSGAAVMAGDKRKVTPQRLAIALDQLGLTSRHRIKPYDSRGAKFRVWRRIVVVRDRVTWERAGVNAMAKYLEDSGNG